MQVQNLSTSPKRVGFYETEIIEKLIKYYTAKGFAVVPHAQLNISYGRIISELDILLEKNGFLTYIEVKSDRDKLSRAFEQVDKVKEYVDYAYVATNKRIDNWDHDSIGLILVSEKKLSVVKKAKRFTDGPSYSSLFALRKKCLIRFLSNGHICKDRFSKYKLAKHVFATYKNIELRECIKEIVTCGDAECSSCPIAIFIDAHLNQ